MTTHDPQLKNSQLWTALGIIAILAIVLAWLTDLFAISDPLPYTLAGAGISSDARFYVYSLGGFLDRSYYWRVDAQSNDIQRIIQYLDLRPSPTIPKEFWRLPPFYWPRRSGPALLPYRSDGFTDDSQGPDGPHYFLLHDVPRNRAYVLFKDNF